MLSLQARSAREENSVASAAREARRAVRLFSQPRVRVTTYFFPIFVFKEAASHVATPCGDA